MLPLYPFEFYAPTSLSELLKCLDAHSDRARVMAGGTDLLPNLKHGVYDIDAVVSLRRLDELKGVSLKNNTLTLGALVKLSEVVSHPAITKRLPALIDASRQIASPQIRNMGTVGGNICLDTRCLYFNQTEFWRSALGYCLKKDGDCCHVVKTGKRCVAAASNDLATVLLTQNTTVTIAFTGGIKEVKLDDFYTANGEKNNILLPGQVVTAVNVDIAHSNKTGFCKLRHRNSIDFPMLSVAVAIGLDQAQVFCSGKVVVNALVAKPKIMDLAEFTGVFYNSKLVEEIARVAASKCHPQTNICDDPSWRKEMVTVAIKRAFAAALVD